MTYPLDRLPCRGCCESLRFLPVQMAVGAFCCDLGEEGTGSWETEGIRISSFPFLAAALTSTVLCL